MTTKEIEVLNVSDVDSKLLKRFRCQETNLATFLKQWAVPFHNAGAGNSTLFINKEKDDIIGYFTLKCSCVRVHDTEMDPDPRFIPAIEISRFALDDRYQKKGLGKAIFGFALKTIEKIREQYIGAQVVILFALPNVTEFYRKFGFEELDKTMSTYECNDNVECICMYSMLGK